jgi:hypothetical protein
MGKRTFAKLSADMVKRTVAIPTVIMGPDGPMKVWHITKEAA